MKFKEQLGRDLRTVFHNTAEFAEKLQIFYAGESLSISGVLDYEGATSRKRPSSDNADGLSCIAAKLYVTLSDFKCVPRQGAQIEIGDELFKIAGVSNELGELILDLERFDE